MIKKKKKNKSPKTIIKERCLKIWSFLVRTKAHNRCEICGIRGTTANPLQAHHIRTRKHISTLLDPENGVCLCATHHEYSDEIAPHSDNTYAVANWLEWVKASKHGKWYEEHDVPEVNPQYKEEDYRRIEQGLLKQLGELLGIAKPTLTRCDRKFKEKYYR